LDESVRWLIANKRIEEAKVIIEKVAKFNKVNLNEVLPYDTIDSRRTCSFFIFVATIIGFGILA
jgi:hypothetical protein